MIDYFSGARAPVSYAIARRGWAVHPRDWEIDGCDLINPGEGREHGDHLEYHATMMATPCESLTGAREIPLAKKGMSFDLGPLRSEEEPRGKKDLQGEDLKKVTRGNKGVDLAWGMAVKTVKTCEEGTPRAIAIENPTRSYHWDMRPLELAMGVNWRRDAYANCAAMGARSKPQALESNVEEMEIVRSKCRHAHSKRGVGPYMG